MSELLIDGDGPMTFLFAHGAGADMQHPFMQQVAKGLAEKGIRVVRFNFPYMVKREEDGRRRPPDRAPKLMEAFEAAIEVAGDGPLVIGGKSMGGRMASLLAGHPGIKGIACLGFPFHPPGKPENFKGEHLAEINVPTLILQGERDTFGNREDLAGYVLSSSVQLAWVPDGDHSFKPRKRSGYSEEENLVLAVQQLATFIYEVAGIREVPGICEVTDAGI